MANCLRTRNGDPRNESLPRVLKAVLSPWIPRFSDSDSTLTDSLFVPSASPDTPLEERQTMSGNQVYFITGASRGIGFIVAYGSKSRANAQSCP